MHEVATCPVRAILFSALLFSVTACNMFDAPVRSARLPEGGSEVSSNATKFRSFRYPIHGLSPASVAALDAFHHGIDDIVVANSGSSTITLYRNLGDGSFREAGEWASCQGGDSVDAEDISGDGFADILVTCGDAATLSLFLGDGKGGFSRHDIATGARPVSAQVAPYVAQAGTPYLAVLYDAPAGLELLYRQRSGSFLRGRTLPVPADPGGMTADVFTRDLAVSYAVVSKTDSLMSTYLNEDGRFIRYDYAAPESPGLIGAFDLRGQSIVDLVVTSATQNAFRLFVNDGKGHFSNSRDYRLPRGPAGGMGSSHLRGVPQPELYFQSATTGEVVIFPVLPAGDLGSPDVIQAGAALTGMVTGRFAHHSDGMDIAMIDVLRSELVVLLNEKQNVR